jgi:exonuclease|nr:exonuclease domain-containing protein [Actinomyces naeslundii]
MNAMIDAAVRNSGNVMEYYVIQVAIIQHRMKAYNDEVLTVQNWLSLGLPAPREDYRIKLRIRLAKAQELVAKSEGRDSTHYHNEWKCLVELGRINKAHKTSCSRVSTGYSIVHPEVSYRRSSSGVHPTGKKVRSPSLIPRRSDLKASTFAAVDFETANESYVSACQVALVLMREGEVVDRYSTYLKPPRGYDYFKNTKLHGIGVKEVLCAPTWLDVSAVISRFIGDVPVWAHNSSFDSGVWRKLDEYYGICTRPRRFYCSLWASKKIIPGLVSYELPSVLRECDPSFHLDHHRADSDAEACARIVCALQRLA